jgi:hypothetical protein
MMKKIHLTLTVLLGFLAVSAQTPKVDTAALMILNRMANVIGDLNSCSFSLSTSIDVTDFEYGTLKQNGTDDVYMVGPDKMLVHSYGDKGHRGFWYNGEQIAYYSFDENNYAIVATPANIVSTITAIHQDYGIEFPAADFFYPTFTDDLLKDYPNIRYLGIKEIDNQECFHILASNNDQCAQFWIADDAYNLPKKFVLTYKNKENMQYEATFSNWVLNPDIPLSVFEFLPPPKAIEVVLLPKNQN